MQTKVNYPEYKTYTTPSATFLIPVNAVGEFLSEYKPPRKCHGLKKSKLYNIWINLKQRCSNKKNQNYKYYGDRGIKVCAEWKYDFKSFYDWSMTNGWQPGLQIDRINNDGNYEPSNCRFITPKENCRNRRSNNLIEYKGEIKTIGEWAATAGMLGATLYHRLFRMHLSMDVALSIPVENHNTDYSRFNISIEEFEAGQEEAEKAYEWIMHEAEMQRMQDENNIGNTNIF